MKSCKSSRKNRQMELFPVEIVQIIDLGHSLAKLATVMERNRLKGKQGDCFNAMLSAAWMNFAKRLKWLTDFLRCIFTSPYSIIGKYEVMTATEVKRKVAFVPEKGQTRFIRFKVSMEFFAGHVYGELVDPQEAMPELQKCKLPIDTCQRNHLMLHRHRVIALWRNCVHSRIYLRLVKVFPNDTLFRGFKNLLVPNLFQIRFYETPAL